MNHYQINEDGSAKVLAAMSKALAIPVVMTPDTKLQGMEIERDMFERLHAAECRERAILETAVTEAIYWLNEQGSGRAYSALTDALAAIKGERKV